MDYKLAPASSTDALIHARFAFLGTPKFAWLYNSSSKWGKLRLGLCKCLNVQLAAASPIQPALTAVSGKEALGRQCPGLQAPPSWAAGPRRSQIATEG
jgi:hypothetical protein